MKKWIFLLALILVPMTAQADFVGVMGSLYWPKDTVSIYIATHDSTGLAQKDMDNLYITRYYRGNLVDSIASGGTRGADHAQVTALGTTGDGKYVIKFRAAWPTANGVDSTGQYAVVIVAKYNSNVSQKVFNYEVIRGPGLNQLYDVAWFLGAGDNGYRVLYPVGGLAPKDSVQYYRVYDTNADADAESTLVSTVIFYHGTNPAILDSSKTIFHYTNP